MTILQSTFRINHPLGEFIAVIVYDNAIESSRSAARREFGEAAVYKELDAGEAFALAKKGGLGLVTANLVVDMPE